jgi:hypothetical protein
VFRAPDDWRDRAVVPHPDERAEPLVFRSHRPQPVQVLVLGLGRRQRQGFAEANACRDRRINQRVERTDADHAQHVGALLFIWTDVPLFERIRRIDWHVARATSPSLCTDHY